jgi:hypothetical protein
MLPEEITYRRHHPAGRYATEEERLQNGLRDLLESTIGREALDAAQKKRDAQVFAERSVLVKKREAIQARVNKFDPVLRKAVDEARRVYDELQGRLNGAAHAWRVAEADLARLLRGAEHEIAHQIDVPLRKTASPSIDAFIRQLDAMAQETSARPRTEESSRWFGKKEYFSTVRSQERRLHAINEARRQAEALKVQAVADLEAEFAKILEQIPPVVLEEVPPMVAA